MQETKTNVTVTLTHYCGDTIGGAVNKKPVASTGRYVAEIGITV
jgi:hypothetical protein